MTWMTRRLFCASPLVTLTAAEPAKVVYLYPGFATVKPVLDRYSGSLPAGLSANESSWNDWCTQSNLAIRARLVQGDLDSMVNLLLFGVTFTTKPRISIEQMAEASRTGLLRGRLEDFLVGLRTPGKNDRLVFVRDLLERHGYSFDTPEATRRTGVYILENLQRVLSELRVYGQRADTKGDAAAAFAERSRLFRDRGVSTDTSILPSFGLDRTLRDMVAQGKLRPGAVTRSAVIGPGLDFADWDGGYDVYPQQTLQPFGLYESLVRLKLSSRPEIRVIDISLRVLEHIRAARQRASGGYQVNLIRDTSQGWLPDLVSYWQAFGTALPGKKIAQPNLETRTAQFLPAAVRALEPADLNIVLQRLAPTRQLDLIVATNIFVYYDEFEQALATTNVADMLAPGGFLLTNNQLPELQSGLRKVGETRVRYSNREGAGDTFLWYQRAQ